MSVCVLGRACVCVCVKEGVCVRVCVLGRACVCWGGSVCMYVGEGGKERNGGEKMKYTKAKTLSNLFGGEEGNSPVKRTF